MWRHAFSVVGLCRLSSIQALSANENYNNKSTDCQHCVCGWANTALWSGKYSTVVGQIQHCWLANTALWRQIQHSSALYGALRAPFRPPTQCTIKLTLPKPNTVNPPKPGDVYTAVVFSDHDLIRHSHCGSQPLRRSLFVTWHAAPYGFTSACAVTSWILWPADAFHVSMSWSLKRGKGWFTIRRCDVGPSIASVACPTRSWDGTGICNTRIEFYSSVACIE